jgi:hypothetical protein
MGKYFDRFPLVDYDGSPAKNILTRVDFTDETKRDIYSNFDFVVQEGMERMDMLSYTYYNSSFYDWMIHISNQNVDPYHDLYLKEEDLRNHIIAKYGSLSSARNKIKYYRNNWAEDDSLITIAGYESLPSDETKNLKKYWKPKLNNLGAIIGYERFKEDWIVSTNKIIELTLTDISAFEVDDILYQSSTGAYGTIVKLDADNSILTVQHIRDGEFEVNEGDGILNINVINQAIPDDEAAYWKYVTAYDYEEEQNQLKRYINMIKASYLPDVDKLFSEKIR